MQALIDTSVLVAAVNVRETEHARCASLLRERANDEILIPVTILAETMSLVRARYGLEAQRRVWRGVETAGIEVVPVDTSILAIARRIDEEYADAGFGFADCTLLACCEQLRVATILSLDARLAVYRPTFGGSLEVLP